VDFLLWLVVLAAVAVFWAMAARGLARGYREIAALQDWQGELPKGMKRWPKVSVVVPSRNEAAGVEQATRSLLRQDYPELEVVAVDDRSVDDTGRILDRLALEDPRLSVVHVKELPPGWLGKNNANHLGARRASGSWVLFTDGDVVFAPDAIRRSVSYALGNGLGHLVAFPHMVAPGFFERAYVATFGLFVVLKFRFWGLREAGSPSYVGVGAFNLVRRDEYLKVGGHAKLALEVLDDAKLGMVLRRSGVVQGAADSGGLITVRWHPGFFASITGVVKNAFAASEFFWPAALAASLVLAALALAPLLGVLLAPGILLKLLAAVPLGLSFFLVGASARAMAGGKGNEGLLYPLCGTAMSLVLIWSGLVTQLQGGIRWRGTLYPLRALRTGCVRERDWPTSAAPGW
jgi:glycosyltransferase involved in cell wall biosynthesis